MLTAYFIDSKNSLMMFLFYCSVVLMSSCTTKYPDVQPAGSSVGNNGSVSRTRVNRPVDPVRKNWVKQSIINTSPQQSEVVKAPKKIINISSLNNRLFEVSEQGDVDAILRLLGQGADIAASNANGETALHSAAAHNQVNATRLLIEKGANVNAQTISGWSPLHSAARFGSTDVVSILLLSGSDRDYRNNAGRTALSLAQQAQQAEVIRVLQSR